MSEQNVAQGKKIVQQANRRNPILEGQDDVLLNYSVT